MCCYTVVSLNVTCAPLIICITFRAKIVTACCRHMKMPEEAAVTTTTITTTMAEVTKIEVPDGHDDGDGQ